ncbi:MAG: hypothetical protein COV41_01495 [Candidatus Brennerbacteria bacterium CG11_big_fil_rev_8_21_14_0_20_43_10]|uniref:Uncharacterized protein n=1 Tax=Candidatus Brennerbacteria bacterium CG11_big_fil_rev_8_21_14_0_20_43_10 TaxID=1974523 RepID=A0A2H0PY15_9BACT|nr:MAG: hypothetical protein COV41_01495 [Candidatus Brennerbacteria bacterium CG11_big_fil_rev_8_21_14_0_20_43_10]
MKKNFYPAIFLILLIVISAVFYFLFFIGKKEPSQEPPLVGWEIAAEEEFIEFSEIFKNNQLGLETLTKAKENSEKIRKDPNNYDLYIEAGIYWKVLGDLLVPTFQKEKAEIFYQKAIKIYQKAIEISQGKAWIPYLNLGNVSRAIKDYSRAETAYRKALELSPGEGMLWSTLAEFYRYDLKKSPEEVKNVYKEGLKVVVINANLLQEYANYLRDIGQLKEALEIFQQLYEEYPAAYLKEEIERIKIELEK